MTNRSMQPVSLGEVTPEFVQSIICRIAATPLLLEEMQGLLLPEHFYKPEEQHIVLMFRAVQGIYERFHALDYEAVRGEIERLLCDVALPRELYEALMAEGAPCGLLKWALVVGTAQIATVPIEQTRDMIRRFLQERAVFRPLQMQLAQGGIPGNMQAVLDVATQQFQRIGQLDADPISGGVPDGRGNIPLQIASTGLSYLDMFMDGGQAPGEAYGLIGPTGVGKTSLTCSMAAAALSQEARRVRENPAYTPKMVYYATYEAGRDEIKQRIISALADISRDTAKRIDFSAQGIPAGFTSAAANNLHAYELAVQLAGQPLQGERERFQNAFEQLSRYLRVIDLSGIGDQRYCRPGIGGLPELVGLIAKDQARLGEPGVAVVYVDYSLLAVERFLSAQGLDITKHTRVALPQFVDGARQQIAGRFNTCVWLLTQFNTTANRQSASKALTHNDAAEAGGRFAHALTFCATLGTKDPITNCVLLSFSKRRRSGGEHPDCILQIDPVFHRLNDVSTLYQVNRRSGTITSREFAEQIGGRQEPAATTGNAASRTGVSAMV